MSLQCYCTLGELITDQDASGLDVSVLERFILAASAYISREIGPFLPMRETRLMNARGGVLYVPALLRLTGDPVNDGAPVPQANVVLRSTDGDSSPFWAHGPYLRIDPAAGTFLDWGSAVNSVAVPGVWGYYEEARATGATLAGEQSVSAETLTVGDGSLLSPGMMLQLGQEWQFVRDYGAVSPNLTTLASSLDASNETLTVASGAALKVGEIIKIDFELLRVLDIQANSVHVARGWNKTKKATHNSGAQVGAMRTFAVTRGVNGSTAVLHNSGTVIERLVVPSDVNYLTRQIATLMLRKAQGGYAGRLANAESGESFYMHEFPREPIERVKSNYYIPAVR